VVQIQFGLETYASFACRERTTLAADLVKVEGVELASYAEGPAVVVLDGKGGKARVHAKGGKYRYETIEGDPLRLKDALSQVKADADGFFDDRAVFDATVGADFPDALQRLWRAHFALAQNTPDVIVSLANGYFAGSADFAKHVNVASTHGGLGRSNSTTFIMSSAGPMPPTMRSMDIPANLGKVTGQRFPLREPMCRRSRTFRRAPQASACLRRAVKRRENGDRHRFRYRLASSRAICAQRITRSKWPP
jgi:hypothetical protein